MRKTACILGCPIMILVLLFFGIILHSTITPLIVYQIEKFQCLELSPPKDLSPGSHMTCVTCPQMCLTVSQL